MLFTDPIFCATTELRPDDIALIHDVGTLTHGDAYNHRAAASSDRAYRALQRARCSLVFVSQATRSSFLERYPADYARLEVIPLYVRAALAEAPLGGAREKSRTILMVGGIERRKNHLRSIEAFRSFGLAAQGFRLKIVGPPGNASDDVVRACRQETAVDLIDFVTNAELIELYRESQILLFPSLLEGFGLPAIEAPTFGALPVVSRGSSLPEIVGDGALLVDPLSATDIAQSLRVAAAFTPEERAMRVRAVRDHQRRYSVEAFRASWQAFLAE